MRASNLSWMSSALLVLVSCGEPAARGNGVTEGTVVVRVEDAKVAVEEDSAARPAADEATAPEAEAAAASEADIVPRAPAPATAEAAARQLAAWLSERDAPVPALLDPTSEIEVAMDCGVCDGTEPGKTTKVIGLDGLIALDRELRKGAILGLWDFGEQIDCKQGCCRFLIDPEVGLQEYLLGLKKVCVRTDEGGKPLAYTRIEGVGARPKFLPK
ncbi:hypothetical protein OV079_22675 [Nannocystis pusilla]|uniref:Lipoprotein n=1 Tax=Nannocystis pusilla TaxID=889268 RepID=A0A9X3EQA9_9BACT|nr:hypothetical protein [Nannocystis pusilla]MCY1008312.1 hypothetical protein [Nannocystis pusilla]